MSSRSPNMGFDRNVEGCVPVVLVFRRLRPPLSAVLPCFRAQLILLLLSQMCDARKHAFLLPSGRTRRWRFGTSASRYMVATLMTCRETCNSGMTFCFRQRANVKAGTGCANFDFKLRRDNLDAGSVSNTAQLDEFARGKSSSFHLHLADSHNHLASVTSSLEIVL